MRVPFVLSIALITTPAVAAGSPAAKDATIVCRHATPSLARDSSRYSGKPLSPRKLTELPPATVYMAVDRRIGGCEAPLTMVDYRTRRVR